MSYPHFFTSDELSSCLGQDIDVTLEPDDMKHARVLRIEEGEHISLADANGIKYDAKVVTMDATGLRVTLLDTIPVSKEPFSVSLFQGLAKGEKNDDIVRAVVEIGVNSCTFFSSSRTVVKLDQDKAQKRLARLGAIAKSAAMQSGRLTIPVISGVVPFKKLADVLNSYDAVLLFWEDATSDHTISSVLSDLIDVSRLRSGHTSDNANGTSGDIVSVACIVGPEGGFSAEEISQLTSQVQNLRVVTLGPSILRTETAGMIAPALVLHELRSRVTR